MYQKATNTMSSRSTARRRQIAPNEPVSLGQSLQRLISDLGIEMRLSERKVIMLWEEVVGPEIARATEPDRMTRGSLHIRVKTAPWRHALMFQREEIRRKLNGRMGEDLIKQIVLK